MPKPRVCVICPHLRVHGGGEGVCAWVLEALREAYHVTLLTWVEPDFAAINRFYGTSLVNRDIELQLALPLLPRRLLDPRWFARLHLWALAAIARRQHDRILFAVDEECDLGGRGLQYVHFPRAHYLRPEAMRRRKWWHATAIETYYRAISVVTGTRVERFRENITLVNSDWTGGIVRRLYGIETVTVHPPAAGTSEDVPWAERRNEFVAVGRLASEKRYPLLIDIVERVRAHGHEVGLTIVGAPGASDVADEVAALAVSRPWVRLERDLSRPALSALLSGTRYGVHGLLEEHFGMAVAEMVLAGQIPFVPNGGGQVEIVVDERLLWSSADDAVAKMIRVLEDTALQESLRHHLAERRMHLSPERFMREIRGVIERALSSAPGAGARPPDDARAV